jgi:hypothetical protein
LRLSGRHAGIRRIRSQEAKAAAKNLAMSSNCPKFQQLQPATLHLKMEREVLQSMKLIDGSRAVHYCS